MSDSEYDSERFGLDRALHVLSRGLEANRYGLFSSFSLLSVFCTHSRVAFLSPFNLSPFVLCMCSTVDSRRTGVGFLLPVFDTHSLVTPSRLSSHCWPRLRFPLVYLSLPPVFSPLLPTDELIFLGCFGSCGLHAPQMRIEAYRQKYASFTFHTHRMSERLWEEYLFLFSRRMEGSEDAADEIRDVLEDAVRLVPGSFPVWWRFACHVKVGVCG